MRLHDLRHSYASVGAGGGDSLLVIGALLGHHTAAMTQRYAHLSDDPLHAAAERISARITIALNASQGDGAEEGTDEERRLLRHGGYGKLLRIEPETWGS